MQEDQQQPAEQPNWSFRPEDNDAVSMGEVAEHSGKEVTWTASEYIAHQKGLGWYALLGLATVAFAGLAYLVTQDMITLVTIIIVAVTFGVYASRPPQTLQYKIDHNGVTVGDKFYSYTLLKSFSLQDEGAIHALLFIPMKRFMPAISVYFPPEQEEEIVNTLSNYLPHEERPPDPIDRLMRKVRF